MSLLAIHQLRVDIDRSPILRDVSLGVADAEVCGLVGESGAGKSMVAKAILGLLPRSARIRGGEILFNGQDLVSLSAAARRKLLGKDIALIPQDPIGSLNPVRRIGDQISDGLMLHLGISKSGAKQRALSLLADVLITDPERVYDAYSHALSGGMRQRVLIAMAFSCSPKLIIADEPTTALDVTVQKQVLRIIRSLQHKQGTSLLFVTHDLGVVAKICDRVVVLFDGRVLENTAATELFDTPGHPYTRALLNAMPRFDQPDKPLDPVPAAVIERLVADTAAFDLRTDA